MLLSFAPRWERVGVSHPNCTNSTCSSFSSAALRVATLSLCLNYIYTVREGAAFHGQGEQACILHTSKASQLLMWTVVSQIFSGPSHLRLPRMTRAIPPQSTSALFAMLSPQLPSGLCVRSAYCCGEKQTNAQTSSFAEA